MKVLVTGGAGFIGSHIVDRLLADGHHVAVIDDLSSGSRGNLPEDVPLHVADIVDTAAVADVIARERPEAICHQAAQMSVSRSVREPLFDAQVNCIGLINVLDAAVANGCRRVVFASSGGVLYGEATSPAPETTAANPISPYGITKWVGERYLSFYAREHGLAAVALRYSNVYGPDVAKANFVALTANLPQVQPGTLTSLNIGTGIGTDVNELEAVIRQHVAAQIATQAKAVSLPTPVHGPARAGDLRSNLVDASLAADVLGWKPTRTLSDGIGETVSWFAQRAAGGDR